MTDTLRLLLPAMAGALLGYFFFGSLWLTVRRGVTTPRAALWFAGGRLLRTGVVLAGFYLLLHHDWRHGVAALLGFVGARMTSTFIVHAQGRKSCA